MGNAASSCCGVNHSVSHNHNVGYTGIVGAGSSSNGGGGGGGYSLSGRDNNVNGYGSNSPH